MAGANKTPYGEPSAAGRFGPYGGRFVAETLVHALDELTTLYEALKGDPAFQREIRRDLANYVGRPTPLYHAARLSTELGGAENLPQA